MDREINIFVPSGRSHKTFVVGLVATPVVLAAYGCFIFYRIHHVDPKLLVFLIAFWLFTTRSILNQLTLRIELSETAIAAQSLFRRRHELSFSEIEKIKFVGSVGRQGIKLIPKGNFQKPLSFAIDVLAPEDRALILAAINHL